MPLRRRMTVAVAVAVAVAVVLAAVASYLAVRSELRANVDRALEEQPLDLRRRGPGRFGPLPARRGGPTPFIQVIDAGDGVEVIGTEGVTLPVQDRAREVAAGVAPRYFTDAEVAGHARAGLDGAARPRAGGTARPLARARPTRCSRGCAWCCCSSASAASGSPSCSGGSHGRNVVAPIVHVTEAARHIAATEDLGRRIEVETQDEVGELAAHFNAMLDTLERSVGGAAAVRGRRLARAAHADHVAAHQHRGAGRARGLVGGRARAAARRRRGADRRARRCWSPT